MVIYAQCFPAYFMHFVGEEIRFSLTVIKMFRISRQISLRHAEFDPASFCIYELPICRPKPGAKTALPMQSGLREGHCDVAMPKLLRTRERSNLALTLVLQTVLF